MVSEAFAARKGDSILRKTSGRKLSVIICVYNMQREASRTINSAIAPYQVGVDAGDYEVIVVDNGSNEPFTLSNPSPGVEIHRITNAHPSPVFAMNMAAREIAKGDKLLFAIDGARIFSSGLYGDVLRAHSRFPDAFVYSLGWHIGPKVQSISISEGYTAEVEDRLIDACGWPENADGLFEVSVFAGSSQGGFFQGIAESNAFSMSRDLFLRYGGYDERFTSPGAGLANLEIFQRYVCRPNGINICLLGEGTFHQVHDSIATSGKRPWATFDSEYRSIFGKAYSKPLYDAVYFGAPRGALRPHVIASLDRIVEGSKS